MGRSTHINIHNFGIHIHINVHCYVLGFIVLRSLLLNIVMAHGVMPSVALELGRVRVDEVVVMITRRNRFIALMCMCLLIFLYQVIEVDPVLLGWVGSVIA